MRITSSQPGPADSPALRLVDGASGGIVPERTGAAERVARENRRSVTLSALDPRWVLAVQVKRALDGGRAAVLAPEARERLLGLGARLGLRPFDTSLVIAVVQDGARQGDDPLAPDVVARLELVGGGRVMPDVLRARSRKTPLWVLLVCASVMGSLLTLVVLHVAGRV